MRAKKWGVVLLLGVFCAMLLVGCGGTKVDFTEMVSVSFSGANGYGKANASLDTGALEKASLPEEPSDVQMMQAFAFLATVEYTVTPREGLSNGETVTVSVSYDEEAAKELKLSPANTTLTFTVEGLAEVERLDPFADVEVEYEGISPFASLITRNLSGHAYLKALQYEADFSTGLAAGDTITLTAVHDEAAALAQGYVLEPKTKEYTVSEVDQYLPDIDLLTDDVWAKVRQEAMDLMESTLARPDDILGLLYRGTGDFDYYMKGAEAFSTPELAHIYFESLKPGDTQPFGYSYNALNLVYKTDVVAPAGDMTLWVAVVFPDIIQRADGSIDVVYSDKSFSSPAANWDDLYRELITADKAHYTSVEVPVTE